MINRVQYPLLVNYNNDVQDIHAAMVGYVIYPDQVTEVLIGRVELEAYQCVKQCIVPNGAITQGSRMTIYFDCAEGRSEEECAFLSEFLNGENRVGIKKKRGSKDEILSDLVEAIEDSTLAHVSIPFRTTDHDDSFSPETIQKFFIAFLGYKTELRDVDEDSFVIDIWRKVEKKKGALENLRDLIKSQFTRKA